MDRLQLLWEEKLQGHQEDTVALSDLRDREDKVRKNELEAVGIPPRVFIHENSTDCFRADSNIG